MDILYVYAFYRRIIWVSTCDWGNLWLREHGLSLIPKTSQIIPDLFFSGDPTKTPSNKPCTWVFVFCAIDRSSLSIQASNQSTQISQIKKIVSKTLCADIFSHYLVPQILHHQSLTLCADVIIFYSIFPHFPCLDTLLLATAATSSPSSMSHPQVTGWVLMFKSLTDTKLVG